MSAYLQQAIREVSDLANDSRFLFRRHLCFQIEEQRKSLDSFNKRSRPHPEPILLRMWLRMNKKPIVNEILLEDVGPTFRLSADARKLIRGLLKDYRALYLKRKAHGRISSDNILVCKGTATLINSLDLDGNADTHRSDFAAIAALIKVMLGDHALPKDVEHFLGTISKEELPSGAVQAFVFNHPAFWSNGKIVENIICLKSHYYCGTSAQTRFRIAAGQILPTVTANWEVRVQQSRIYKRVLAQSPNYEEPVVGLALLVFFRDALLHTHKERAVFSQEHIENDLYVLFPDFLAHLMEKLYQLADVRDICGR